MIQPQRRERPNFRHSIPRHEVSSTEPVRCPTSNSMAKKVHSARHQALVPRAIRKARKNILKHVGIYQTGFLESIINVHSPSAISHNSCLLHWLHPPSSSHPKCFGEFLGFPDLCQAAPSHVVVRWPSRAAASWGPCMGAWQSNHWLMVTSGNMLWARHTETSKSYQIIRWICII